MTVTEVPDGPSPEEEMIKNEIEGEIEQMKRIVEDATVEEVETPAGRKDVEIAFSDDEQGFCTETGAAIGVYFEPSRLNPYEVSIDWAEDSPSGASEKSRTSVQWKDVEHFEESDYYRQP